MNSVNLMPKYAMPLTRCEWRRPRLRRCLRVPPVAVAEHLEQHRGKLLVVLLHQSSAADAGIDICSPTRMRGLASKQISTVLQMCQASQHQPHGRRSMIITVTRHRQRKTPKPSLSRKRSKL